MGKRTKSGVFAVAIVLKMKRLVLLKDFVMGVWVKGRANNRNIFNMAPVRKKELVGFIRVIDLGPWEYQISGSSFRASAPDPSSVARQKRAMSRPQWCV
jgi:hypothetical protein